MRHSLRKIGGIGPGGSATCAAWRKRWDRRITQGHLHHNPSMNPLQRFDRAIWICDAEGMNSKCQREDYGRRDTLAANPAFPNRGIHEQHYAAKRPATSRRGATWQGRLPGQTAAPFNQLSSSCWYAAHLDDKLRSRLNPSDIVQESYCDAHRDFEKFHGRSTGEFLAWLRTILVNNIAREVERRYPLCPAATSRGEVRLDRMPHCAGAVRRQDWRSTLVLTSAPLTQPRGRAINTSTPSPLPTTWRNFRPTIATCSC